MYENSAATNHSLLLLSSVSGLGINQIKCPDDIDRIIKPQGPLEISAANISSGYVNKCKEDPASPHQQERPVEARYITGSPGLPNLRDDSDAQDNIAQPTDNFQEIHLALRCLTASNKITDAAAETFREAILPSMGILTS